MKLKLIEGAHNWWRFWSTRIQMVAAFLTGWLFFDPASMLYIWSLMPAAVTDMLPGRFLQTIGALLFALNILAVLARVTVQKKLEKPDA